MKKLIFGTAIFLLTASLALGGCTRPAPSPTPAPKPAPPAITAPAPAPKAPVAPTSAPKPAASPTAAAKPAPAPARVPFDQQPLPRYVVATQSPGGVAWILASGWVGIISKYTPIKGSITLIPGLTDSIEPLRRGEVDFFWLSPSQPWSAYSGAYEKRGIKKISVRLLLGPKGDTIGAWQIWTLKSSDIKAGKDVKGKRVGIVPSVVWAATIVNGVMNANGMTDKDYTRVDYASAPAAFNALVEKKIDALPYTAGSEALEKQKTVGLRDLPLTKAETDAIIKLDPTIVAGNIRPNYMGTDEVTPKWGIVAPSGFWARTDLNEKTVYTMVKALWDNLKEFQEIHERATDIKLENALDLLWTVPYHPGAIRYYKEKGLWKPEHTAKQKQLIEQERKMFGSVYDEAAFKELGILP